MPSRISAHAMVDFVELEHASRRVAREASLVRERISALVRIF